MMKYENRLRRSPVEESLGGSLGNQAILRSGREAGYLVDVPFDKVRELPYGLGPSSGGLLRPQPPVEGFAGASMALWTSDRLSRGTSAIEASVAGLMTPKVSPDSEGTHLPSMKIDQVFAARGSVVSVIIRRKCGAWTD